MKIGSRVGTLEADQLADLIVVDGNPLEDLSALENVEGVVQGGEPVTIRQGYRADRAGAEPDSAGPR